MAAPLCPWWLDVEQFDETLVVRFQPREPLDEQAGYALQKLLAGLVEERGARHLVLNFGYVEYVNSMMIGRLLALNKQFADRRGRLTLCGVTADLRELFELVRLPLLIPIYEHEEEALEALASLKARPPLARSTWLRRAAPRTRPARHRVH